MRGWHRCLGETVPRLAELAKCLEVGAAQAFSRVPHSPFERLLKSLQLQLLSWIATVFSKEKDGFTMVRAVSARLWSGI